uniref:Uncharacterized protein n=1 Tax=Prolemur simus TaxID=1328070 RepID=A0A8C9ASY2_PROSS
MQEEEARKLQQKRAQMLREAVAAGQEAWLALDGEAPDEEEQEDGTAQCPPNPWEAASQCGQPKLSGATRSGCECRAPSHRCLSEPCPLPSAVPWRPRSGRCGGQPGEALPWVANLPALWSSSLGSPDLPAVLCRMKSLEQDALRAQMVLSKSQEGRSKRGPLERLAEAPSPAPTPSPTPLEGLCDRDRRGVQPASWTSPNACFLSPQTSVPRPAPPLDAW